MTNVANALAEYEGTTILFEDNDEFSENPHSVIGRFCFNLSVAIDAEWNPYVRVAGLRIARMGLEREDILRIGQIL